MDDEKKMVEQNDQQPALTAEQIALLQSVRNEQRKAQATQTESAERRIRDSESIGATGPDAAVQGGLAGAMIGDLPPEYVDALKQQTQAALEALVEPWDKITRIAYVVHEANRAYCNALGDYSQLPWGEAPEWQRESCRKGVQYAIDTGFPGPEAMHANWMKDKQRDGWTYGWNKDPVAKTHPCLVPYDALPVEQRAKDYIFQAIVRALV